MSFCIQVWLLIDFKSLSQSHLWNGLLTSASDWQKWQADLRILVHLILADQLQTTYLGGVQRLFGQSEFCWLPMKSFKPLFGRFLSGSKTYRAGSWTDPLGVSRVLVLDDDVDLLLILCDNRNIAACCKLSHLWNTFAVTDPGIYKRESFHMFDDCACPKLRKR